MDPRQAAETLEVIRTLMERTCRYQLLTARAGLVAGSLAAAGALAFVWLDAANPVAFGFVWGVVFAGALSASCVSAALRSRVSGERVWSRQARAVLLALVPSFLAALALTVFFFARGAHLLLPGVWMLCYGQGALATSAYAPPPVRWLGWAVLGLGAVTLFLGPAWAVAMMAFVFGAGHVVLGIVLLHAERRRAFRVYREVA